MTCNEIIEALTALVQRDAKYGEWPVHILDMRGDLPADQEHPTDGLVTHIDTDCMAREQGYVVSLCSWRSNPRSGAKTTPWELTPLPEDDYA